MGTLTICSATFWEGNTDFVKMFLILLNLLDSTLTFIPKTAFDSWMASNFLSSSKWIAEKKLNHNNYQKTLET